MLLSNKSDHQLDFQLSSINFTIIREASLAIADPLSEKNMQIQSMVETSPTKWHLAYTS